MTVDRTESFDVVVVGAGLSGLQAATTLSEKGLHVLVLEARERVGGRTHSIRIGESSFDIGGQWLGPTQNRVQRLATKLGIATFPTHHEGVKHLELDGKRSTYTGSIPSLGPLRLLQLQASLMKLDAMTKRVDCHNPLATRDALTLDTQSLETFTRRWVKSRRVRRAMDVAVETIFGARASEISLLWFLHYCNGGGGFLKLAEVTGGAQERRFAPGAQSLCDGLAQRLGSRRVRLGEPVRRITYKTAGGVAFQTDSGSYRSRRAVVAVPPPLLPSIIFDPALPAARQQLHQRMPMGSTLKWLATYDRAFWRDAGWSGEIVSSDGPLNIVYDNVHADGQPCLVGLTVGPAALRWGAVAPSRRKAAIIDHLASFFGPAARRVRAWHDKDWGGDPWSRGCPVASMVPGAMTSVGHTLTKPVGPLHWAGTETAARWPGYMEGALEAGERSAAEVIDALARADRIG